MNNSIDQIQSIHAAIYALRKPILDKIKNMTVSKLLLRNATDHPHETALFSFPKQDYQSPYLLYSKNEVGENKDEVYEIWERPKKKFRFR